MAWQFWVDRGGTFTDVVARSSDGAFQRTKLLSEDPERYEDAAIEAMRRITGTHDGPLPPAELRLGTTVATNALLEHKGEPVLLAITAGLGDALRIATQDRPELFVRHIVLPEPLYADVAEIDERIGADGAVERELDEDHAGASLQAAYDNGLRSVAIVLMHGYRHTAHEARLEEIARAIGFTQVSASHRVAPLIKLVARGQTAVVDAYLSPVLQRYVRTLESGLGEAVTALFMQSSGGLTAGAAFHGKDAVLSGPAGGIVGMAATAREAGFGHVIGFDMGGTSTDVSHYAGAYERDNEAELAGTRIRAPMMRINTVAAGGGSICRFDGVRFLVGPESAGAQPGPACYRAGGPLAVTDCNLLLGKLQPEHFPHVFGALGDEPLDMGAAEARMDAILADVKAATGQQFTRQEAAEGFLAIAVANMANAIKAISLRRGHDVTRAALASFGGAGGQHACLVADALGIETVLCHPLASVLSAYGMGLAERSVLKEATLRLSLDAEHEAALGDAVGALGDAAAAELAAQCGDGADVRRDMHLLIRPQGSESAIEVSYGSLAAMQADFARLWQARFGFAAEGVPIAEMARVEAVAGNSGDAAVRLPLPDRSAPPEGVVSLYTGGAMHRAPLYRREGLAEGFSASGPALVVDDVSTIVIEPGWQMRVDGIGNLILTRTEALRAARGGTEMDPVRLEVMGALFMAVAEEMGAALQHSASSVNIRERLDFSCAVFDRQGQLVANAPHMPVHLGSMGESVRTVLSRRGDARDGRGIRRGDVYALNAPYDGGTHLPDLTVIMPVFAAEGDAEPAWFVAARGHHADIGGIAPGSMPANSRTVDEEGILIDNVLLVEDGRLREVEFRALLASGPWPARNPDRNMDDLRAQIAACNKGATELQRIATEQGRDVVDAYMGHVQDAAEEAVRAVLGRLKDGAFVCPMDNGAQISVAVRIDHARREATIDFTGTSAQLADNFNAPCRWSAPPCSMPCAR